MCGIAGYSGARQIASDRIDGCLSLMRRRGPDHQAARHWVTPAGQHVHLLHSRLNIIDLDARANQPLKVDGRSIVYNGELYNYLELRRELTARGHVFATESDTEVLLRAIAEWGTDALDRCEGMWAFAVYDENSGSLILSRDRFGEKPLYLFRDADGLYFGSEIKFIAALAGRRLDINYQHLYRYLVNGYKSLYKQPATFFTGVHELPAATTMTRTSDGVDQARAYWEPESCFDEAMSYEEAVAGVRDRLVRAVELRLRADVPLAFCMSGGVDSNSLISIAKRVFGYDVHGFTITTDDARYDEEEMVAESVRVLGIRHTSIPATTEAFLDRLASLVSYHDAPVYTVSYYLHWLLMEQVAAHGYRIAVSGTAADELFTGYYDHHNLYLQAVAGTTLFEPSLDAWRRWVAPVVRNPFLQNPRLYLENPHCRDHVYLNAAEFASYLRADWSEAFTESDYSPSPLRNRMLNEMFHESVPVILHEDDLNAMYHSVENRSPFLDRALFEFAYAVPSRHLVRDGFAKAPLRDAMRGIVPDGIVENHRKVGFNAPIFSLIAREDPSTRERLLADSPIFEHVRLEKIAALLDEPRLENSASKFLFNFISAKLFLERFD